MSGNTDGLVLTYAPGVSMFTFYPVLSLGGCQFVLFHLCDTVVFDYIQFPSFTHTTRMTHFLDSYNGFKISKFLSLFIQGRKEVRRNEVRSFGINL